MSLEQLHKILIMEGEGGMIWENGIETCILSCKKKINNGLIVLYVVLTQKKKNKYLNKYKQR